MRPTLHLIGKSGSHHALTPESYLTLKINIEFVSGDRLLKSIVVTSSIRGEGKTRTALNLAIAYAQAGMKVILIDADFRKPGIHLLFEGEPYRGLTSILSNQYSADEVVQGTNIDNLDVMIAGSSSLSSTELLTSARMDSLLEDMQLEYDAVILDTPPILDFIETKVLASKCDGVLLVLEHGKVRRGLARKVKEELTSVRANLLGVVLNKTQKKGLEVYYH